VSLQGDDKSVRSQFFVCLMPMAPELRKEVVAFGRVLSGMEVLDYISTIPADGKGRPLESIIITDSGEVGDAAQAALS